MRDAVVVVMFFLVVASSLHYLGVREDPKPPRDMLVFSSGDSGVYVNLSIRVRDTIIVLRGWFNESGIQGALRLIIDHIMKRYGMGFFESVKVIVEAWSLGQIEGVPGVYIGWRSFTVKGGWCWGAVERATYILRMYSTPYLDVVLKNPYHRILLLKNYTGEQVYVENHGRWSLYINFPETSIPSTINANDTWRIAYFAPIFYGWKSEGC